MASKSLNQHQICLYLKQGTKRSLGTSPDSDFTLRSLLGEGAFWGARSDSNLDTYV